MKRALLLALTIAGAAACGKDDPTGPATPSGQTAILDITNSTSVSIWYVRIRDCGASTWGQDLLGADIITAGLGQSFTVSAGCHDVRLETSAANNGEAVYTGVNFPAGQIVAKTVTTWTPKS